MAQAAFAMSGAAEGKRPFAPLFISANNANKQPKVATGQLNPQQQRAQRTPKHKPPKDTKEPKEERPKPSPKEEAYGSNDEEDDEEEEEASLPPVLDVRPSTIPNSGEGLFLVSRYVPRRRITVPHPTAHGVRCPVLVLVPVPVPGAH